MPSRPSMIVYGNPVAESEPLVNYRKNWPARGGLITIDAELTRTVTASTLYTAALVDSAQRMTLADELVAAGTSHGVGWTLTASQSLGVEDGFETVRLQYLKQNVSPLEYGNPSGVSIALTDTQGIVKWRGVPYIWYDSPNAREGFQMVNAPQSGSIRALVAATSIKNTFINGATRNEIYYTLENPVWKDIPTRAFNLLLGGEVVAQSVATPAMYTPAQLSAAPMYVASTVGPVRIIGEVSTISYATPEEAMAAGNQYMEETMLPRARQIVAELKAAEDAGNIVCGFTRLGAAGVELIGDPDDPETTLYGYLPSIYVLKNRLPLTPSQDLAYCSPVWEVDKLADTAICFVGNELLKLPPDESDSGSASGSESGSAAV